ncbi:hypothetical protein ACFV4G_38020 [Kitasatospora sp. NPDC059747]|uniref:hypothetical protein n=1 Tax=Kitasatospora sp. NPDC059747 TaxID=3346930 RepID=UPI003649371F
MAVREDAVPDVRHEAAPHGRHGRPRPFGGRFRLPTLRFSGAAMAMSTVVGISIATTLLLHEQQGIGRRAGVARVGTTPPPTPSGSGTEQAEAAAEHPPAAPEPSGRPSASRPARPHPGSSTPVPSTHRPGTPEPTAAASEGGHTGLASTDDPSAQGRGATAGHGPAAPSGPASTSPQTSPQMTPTPSPAQPSGQPSPSPSASLPSGTPSFTPRLPTVPSVVPAVPGSDITPNTPAATGVPDTTDTAATTDVTPGAEQPLSGVAQVSPLGRDGTRHVLGLSVTEPVTALQTEFRLAPGELAPGSGTAWTDLPGAVVTAQQERGALVYRFTTPAGTDVGPGHYTFGVRGTRPTATAPRKGAAAEGWNAAAFGITDPRAVSALGTFTEAAPQAGRQPAPPEAPSKTPPEASPEARSKTPPVHH